MSFARPTLSDLISSIRADLLARFPGADSGVRRAVVEVLARVLAGAANELYGFLQWTSRQVLPDTADLAQMKRWAAIWGVPEKESLSAAGPITLTGVDTSTVLAGTLLQSGADAQYSTQTDATIAGGVATVDVAAVSPGVAGDLGAGSTLTFLSPQPGVSINAVVAAGGIVGGRDEETAPELLARLLGRIQNPPAGGAAQDYVAWALQVPDVTRAWVTSPYGGATNGVGVTFVCDDRPDIIPTSDDVAAAAAWIDPLRPVTANVTVYAPTGVAMNLTIHPTPSTADTKAAITASLADLLARKATPGGSIEISQIRAAVSDAAGVTDNVISTPTADVTHTAGQIAVLGTITWI